MVWVEEADVGPLVCVAGVLGLTTGAAAWWLHNFWAGALAYLGIGCATIVARQLWLQARLPRGARSAARQVLAWLRERHPDERVEEVAVRAVEPGRFVIAVRSGLGRPTPRRYFAVPRLSTGEITELPAAEWRPRGLK